MFFKIVLKKFVNFTEKICVGVFFNKVAGSQNSSFIKKRLQHRIFPAKFENTLFYRSPVAASAYLRFPGCNFVKKETPAKMFFCQFYKIFKNIFWQNTFGWLLIVFIWEFWEVFLNTSFIEHLILSTSYRISTTRCSKKLFHKCLSSILYTSRK